MKYAGNITYTIELSGERIENDNQAIELMLKFVKYIEKYGCHIDYTVTKTDDMETDTGNSDVAKSLINSLW